MGVRYSNKFNSSMQRVCTWKMQPNVTADKEIIGICKGYEVECESLLYSKYSISIGALIGNTYTDTSHYLVTLDFSCVYTITKRPMLFA